MSRSASKTFVPADLEVQLERILSHPKFVVAEQLSRFLRFVVEAAIAGRQEEIKQYTIAVEALGRSPDFNPQVDASVRMQAGQLRRALHRYYETDGAADPIRIEIPKGRYVPVFSPNSDPAQRPHAPAEPAISAATPQAPSPPPSDSPSIAVLPFEFLGNDPEEAYFATGLTEEIIIALTRFPGFLVVGPLSRHAIDDPIEGIRHIGQQYQVRFVLDGTIRKRGQTFRLTAKLTDTTSGQHLWGQALAYHLDTTSVLEIEQEVVGQVVATIADGFGVIPRTLAKETLDGRANRLSDYEAILRFHHHFSVLTETSQVEAVTALEHLLQRDPHHAQAAALLGDLTASIYHLGYADSAAVLEQAERLGRQALALDPNCQSAHCTMALVHFLNFRRGECLEAVEHILRLNSNYAFYVSTVAYMLTMMGDGERGLELMRKAMRINPHHPGWYHIASFWDSYHRGAYDDAWIEAQHFNTPNFFFDPLIRAASLGQLGRCSEARAAGDQLLALVPDFKSRGRSLIRRIVFMEDHVEMLAAGLRKAGLSRLGSS